MLGLDIKSLGQRAPMASNHPRDIFMGLPNKEYGYEYPRDVQSEVWEKWYESRHKRNVVIKMNTGSGKTVVALLILKSLIGEGFRGYSVQDVCSVLGVYRCHCAS